MASIAPEHDPEAPPAWPDAIFASLKAAGVRQASYVPDAGHARLIRLLEDDPDITATVLTTEEEGIAIAVGAWLGGMRAAVLMQSSGVGNCVNMLALPAIGRFPLLMLVTMRGEWAEFNPWQVPMGRAVEPVLAAMGVATLRIDTADEAPQVVDAALRMAFEADQQVAVLLGQRLIGAKKW